MRAIDLMADCQVGALVGTGGYKVTSNPVFFRGDDLILRITLRDYNDQDKTVYAAHPIDGSSTLQLGAKAEEDYAGSYVVLAENTAFNLPGDWTATAPSAGCLSCRLNLRSAALLTLLGASTAQVNVIFDLQEVAFDGSISTLVQFLATVKNDVIRGTEGAVADADPAYYTADQVAALFVRKSDFGSEMQAIYLWNADQGRYLKVTCKGAVGAAYLDIEQ